jgi:hypothetical protein
MTPNNQRGLPRKKKINVTITISPYLKKRLDMLVEDEEFSSISDLATIAFTNFLTEYKIQKVKETNKQPSKKQPITIVEDCFIEDEDTEF